MEDIRSVLRRPHARPIVTVGALAAVSMAAWYAWGALAPSAANRISHDRTFICARTGKAFDHRIQIGETIPVKSPYSGEKTGYPAELCFWRADGGTKQDPTLVLLKKYTGSSDPTFCPDCKRMVVGLNPAPEPGRKPPITQQEYLEQHAEK